MAHPMKEEGVVGHNKKLKKMTRDYGAANKKMFKSAPGTLESGLQTNNYGYGTEGEGEASAARGDRSRRSQAANPIATYKTGGRVHEKHKAEVRAGGGSVIARARGGRIKKPATNITIMVAPQAPQGSNPALPPAGVGPVPPGGAMPPPGPPGGPAPMAGGPIPPLPPGMPPPGMMAPRKRGGAVNHSDEAEDKELVKEMVKPGALKRKHGGKVLDGAGAESGPGRLARNQHME